MDFTGERFIPTLESPEISYEHWHRYFYASHFVKDKTVLDIACGEGYGSYLLAQSAQHVIGMDLDSDSINYAASRYVRSNLEFKVGSTNSIPVEGESVFDSVVSFETIEHISEAEQDIFLHHVKRLLKPDGLFLVSTPNKLIYSDIPGYKNEFHVKEFYIHEFQSFLKRYFKNIEVLGQKIYSASYIWLPDVNQSKMVEYRLTSSGVGFRPTDEPKTILYQVAWCSDVQTEEPPSSVLIDLSERILTVRDHQIAAAQAQVVEQERQIGALSTQIAEKNQAVAQAQAQIGTLSIQGMEKEQALAQAQAKHATERERLAQETVHLQASVQLQQELLLQREQQVAQLIAERERLAQEAVHLRAGVQAHPQDIEQKAEQLVQLVAEREQLAQRTQAIEVAMEGEVQRLQTSLMEKEQELCALMGSESYRLGLLLSWPLRKTWTIIQRTLGHTDRPRAYYPQSEGTGQAQQLGLESASAQAQLISPLISPIAGVDLTTWREMSFISEAANLLESLEVSRLPSPDEMSQRYLEPLAALWAEHLAQRAAAHIDEWAFGTRPANPRRSIIVPLYGRYDFLLHQVHHFCRDRDFDETDLIYVVDDPAIIDGVMQLATTISTQYTLGFRVVYAGANYGYAAANNLGARYARAPLLVLLNSDVFPVEKGWLSCLETVHASLPMVGALGVRLLFEDRSIQHAGLTFRRDARFPGVWLIDHPGKGLPEALVPSRGTVPVSAVTGACLMIGAELYHEVGGLDEGYMLGDFEDSDLCLTLLSRGYINYLADDIVLYHLERQSQGIRFDATLKFKLTLCNAFRHTARWDGLIREIGGNAGCYRAS